MSWAERVGRDLALNRAASELERAQNDLYYLCTEYLNRSWNVEKQTGMTAEFHLPLCKRMDKLRSHPRVLTMTARGGLKTTVFTIGLAIQEILRDPDICILITHAVEEEAQKILAEIADHLRSNSKLRKLRPEIMPAVNNKRFASASELTIRRTKFSRQPTVLAKGAGSELTGAHVDLIFLDDVIARRTIENSELAKIASWYRNTALPVLNPSGRIRAVGTRWHPDDLWGVFLSDPSWDCVVRGALELDGKPDDKGEPVLYGPPGGIPAAKKRLSSKKVEMGPDWAPQMQNDASPSGEKPWDRECERTITLQEASGPGVVVVLSDPAPAKVGSTDTAAAKVRADGSKDDWSIAVFKLRRKGDQYEAILLDGKRSKDWDMSTGFDEMYRLGSRWHATHGSYEAGGQVIAIYESEWNSARARSGKRMTRIELEGQRRADAKNVYFSALASMNNNGEFIYCAESCDKDFLNTTLNQLREWRPMPGGKNGLRYDDCGNVVSMVSDPAIRRLAPKVEPGFTWSPYRSTGVREPEYGTRYIKW